MQRILFYGVPQGSSFGSIVALEWLGQPYRLCRIEMLQQPWDRLYGYVNPLYLTPALLLENRQVLTESLAILLHLANLGLDQGLGFRQGTREFDRLNQMLAYLNTDFYSAFNPLWTAYEMQDLELPDRELLRTIGRKEVAKNCMYLNALLADQEWLLGGEKRTVADAYLTGIGRWVEYHQLFDLQQEYPHLHRYLQKLKSDPAVMFAEAIENEQATTTNGKFMGHVTLEELRSRLVACKYVLLKNEESLNESQLFKLSQVKLVSPILGKMHELKEDLRNIFEKNTDWLSGLFSLGKWLNSLLTVFSRKSKNYQEMAG